jgi:ATP-dependent DNA helicase RecQ
VDDFDPAAVPLEREAYRRAYEQSRIEMMRGYAEGAECRRRCILNYFGEQYEPSTCGMCDLDRPRSGDQRIVVTAEAEPVGLDYEPGQRVTHEAWGVGTVQSINGSTLTVLFETVGYKTLAINVVQAGNLLKNGA